MPALSYSVASLLQEPDFASRMEYFRKLDEQRDELFRALYAENIQLRAELNKQTTDYDNEIQSRRLWQEKARALELELQAVSSFANTRPFVLALIDGDGVLFNDDLIRAGKDGGSRAASMLHAEIKNYTATKFEIAGRYDVVANIYINFAGLAGKLAACGIIETPADFRAWMNAFSINQSLFNFIDVGDGKERADHKLKETFRLFIDNHQCKHIIFGGCHDAGYLTFLDTYKLSDKAFKISLLKSVAEPHILQQFKALNFALVNFPSLFRSTNLPERRKSLTPPQIPATLVPSPSIAPPSSQNWAAVSGGSGVEGKVLPVASVSTPTLKTAVLSNKKIFRNADGERVDIPLPKPDRAAIFNVNSRIQKYGHLCNEYHLTGKCSNSYCDYQHGDRLTAQEQLALRVKARGRLCNYQSECVNAQCFFGHVCPNVDCRYEKCNFQNLHNIDKTPRVAVDEHGNIEVLAG